MAHRSTVTALLAAACLGQSPTGPAITGTGRRILFIGNSHTSVNDVPGILQALAAAGGPEPLAIATDVTANFALIDHWNSAATRADIGRGGWAFVVLQQGWTPAGPCRDTLRLATKHLAADATATGAKTALYQVWAPANLPAQVPGTIRSYELAATDVGGLLFPAADAFRVAMARDPSLTLYADGLHASPQGSYLAALVMYAVLFDRTPVGLPARITTAAGTTIDLSPAVALTLQEAAADVTVRHLGGSNGADGPTIAQPGSC